MYVLKPGLYIVFKFPFVHDCKEIQAGVLGQTIVVTTLSPVNLYTQNIPLHPGPFPAFTFSLKTKKLFEGIPILAVPAVVD